MNATNLQLIFDQYIEQFDFLNDVDGHDEGYKWRAESCFVEHWDIDAEDFPAMFKAAMSETSNLIDNATVQPINGITMLLKHTDEVEYVRECFRDLFSADGGDLEARLDRIDAFIQKINAKIDQYAHGSWKYPQKRNDVIYYLNLWRPEENYIFKATEATDWANCIEFGDDFGSGETFSLAKYYRMCDELLAAVSQNDEIMKLHSLRFEKEAVGFDDELHILVYDIMFCAHNYNFYNKAVISTTSTKARVNLAKAKEKIAALEESLRQTKDELNTAQAQASVPIEMVGQTVTHKVFKEGKIITQTGDVQLISFGMGEKKFQFPQAYIGGFLKADAATMDRISGSIELKKKVDELKTLVASQEAELVSLKSSIE